MIAAVTWPMPGKLRKIAASGWAASSSRILFVIARTWLLSSSSWSANSSALNALPAVVPGEADSRFARSRSARSSGRVRPE